MAQVHYFCASVFGRVLQTDAILLPGTHLAANPASGGDLLPGALYRSPDATPLAGTRLAATPANAMSYFFVLSNVYLNLGRRGGRYR